MFDFFHIAPQESRAVFVFFPLFLLSHLLSSPFFFPLPLINTRNSDSRGQIEGSFPPLPTTVRALHFNRGKISTLSSLVDSHVLLIRIRFGRNYQGCVRYGTGILGTGMDIHTELTEVSSTGIDIVPNLPKCPVPVLMLYRN